jgi:hypothetical protein
MLWIGQDNIHGRWHVSNIGGDDFENNMNETLIVFHNLVETLVGIFLALLVRMEFFCNLQNANSLCRIG